MLDTSQSNELREIFNAQIKNLPKDVALCLSGGIDSVALLSLLLNNDKRVHVYSFTLDNYESYDFKTARELATQTKCEFTPVYLPSDIQSLKSDVLRLHNQYDCCKKTDYECVWPFLHIYPHVQESVIVTGLGAEGHFGSTKRGSLHYKNDLDAFRDWFFTRPNVSQTYQHVLLCRDYGKSLYCPFLTPEIRQFFVGKTWAEVNTPKIKQPILDLIDCDVTVRSSNLQLGSKVAEHFDTLLSTDWNLHMYKSVVGILNCVNRGELPHATTKLF